MHPCYKCSNPLNENHCYGLHPECFTLWFGLTDVADFIEVHRHPSDSERASSSQAFSEYWQSSFFQGQFKKYSANLGNQKYIIKVQETFAPELPLVEFLSNQIAATLKINVPSHYLIDFYDIPSFVSLNFMSSRNKSYTMNHLYHYIEHEKQYQCTYIIEIIEKYCGKFEEVEKFINICLFDALIGNHDRHGRNLGLLLRSNEIILAPMYDNTSALGLEHGPMLRANFNPRGKISTSQTTEPTMKDYVEEFVSLSLEKNVIDFYQKIDLNDIEQLIENSFCSELMKYAIKKLVQTRYKELQDAIYQK